MKVKGGLGELNKFAGDVKEFFTKERQDGNLSQLGDARQGSISIEIWKNAFTDALKRLCPLQGHDAECGCLPVLGRQVLASDESESLKESLMHQETPVSFLHDFMAGDCRMR